MQINALFRTSAYRGDHSADVAIAIKAEPSDTIDTLITRCWKSQSMPMSDLDWIELRVVNDTGSGIDPKNP